MQNYIFSIVLLVVLFSGCKKQNNDLQVNNSPYTEQVAMSHFIQEPEQALCLLDSALAAGNLTSDKAEYLMAQIYFAGLNNKAIALNKCEQLLIRKSVQQNAELLQQVHSLIANIGHSSGDDILVMRHAPVASELAEQLDRYAEVAKMTSYIAFCMARGGKTDEAVETIKRTADNLSQQQSYQCMLAYISVQKSLLSLLHDAGDYNKMISVCEAVIDQLDYFEQHNDLFTGMPEGFDPAEFVSFSRGQIYAFTSVAYAQLGNREEAHHYDRLARETVYGTKPNVETMLITAYLALGEYDKMDAAYDRWMSGRTDTVNQNYVILMHNRALAAERQNKYKEANQYLHRAEVIKDSLNNRQLQEQIAAQNTAFHLQEQTHARERAEAQQHQSVMILNFTIVFLIIAIGFAGYFFITRRNIKQKNRVLVKMIDEQQKAKDKPEDNSKLYNRLLALVVDERLYADNMLNREMVTERLGVRRQVLNQLLNQYAEGKSFPQWLNDIRITEACRLLHDEPEMSIAEVAVTVGLSPKNMRHLFSTRYGISPSEYRLSHCYQ